MRHRDQVRARAAAAALYAAACKEERVLWDTQERLHSEALTSTLAMQAAEPLLAVCSSCPVRPACRTWAEVDGYTGIAAGASYVNGARHETDTPQDSVTSIAS